MENFKACFVGLGYIGLPTAIIAADKGGVEVVGVDINPSIVEATNAGRLHFIEPGMEEMLQKVVANGSLRAATAPESADAYFIVVPTPFKGDHLPDISYVEAATRSVIPYLHPGSLFVIESTSPMGTTEQMAELIFSERPELKGKIHIAYCPERVLPGNVVHELVNNDRVIGGIDPASTEEAVKFYARFVTGQLHRTNARTAEMCKLTENSSRDVQIAFANELSMICDKAGINVWELISLANKHPRVNILWPGCGVGGHCIAVDPYFITAAYPNTARIIATAREINNHKSDWSEEKIKNAILRFRVDRGRLPRVALMGLAFKPDIDDLRESPAKKIALNVLKECKNDAEFMVVEPNIPNYKELELSDCRKAYDKADIVVFLTAHTPFKLLEINPEKVELDFCGVRK
ncbi:MAG: UDP-N-acetyl-D-mannosamine dehydrogenase [Bacteroides sp.]|nr:UDP-N-acetyl-D-mannosamine dehydrogenase [Bacteroides sp.]MCM1379270.1 UDP-N-acetyl-D-mannosamine dehydrogenase [Bacteroides sp.]MCM1445072.1 UDP-N-acetyl-D-mannosamine dehydrogenase [Prevotella sp.]